MLTGHLHLVLGLRMSAAVPLHLLYLYGMDMDSFTFFVFTKMQCVESSWNVMAYGDAWKGKWMGNWRMEWVTSTLHTTSEHGVSSITTADAHASAASSWLNWRPRRFKWTRLIRRKTKSGFCACAIAFQTQSTPRRTRCGAFVKNSQLLAVGRMQFYVLNMAAYGVTTMLWKLHDAVSTDRIIYCQMEGRLGCLPSKYRQLNWPWPV